MAKNKDQTAGIREAIETTIAGWLKPNATLPSKEQLAVIDRGLDYLKIAAKLDEEGGWGDDLEDLDKKKRRGDD